LFTYDTACLRIQLSRRFQSIAIHTTINWHQNCEDRQCPWVFVEREDKYICLKCDKEKRLSGDWGGLIWIIIIALLLAVVSGNKPMIPGNQEQQPPQTTRQG